MKIRSSILLGAALSVSGCAVNPQTGQPEVAPAAKAQFSSTFNSDDPCSNNDRNIGMVAGAVAGGVIGYLTHGAKGAAAGVLIGAGGGFLIGHALDSRRCELHKIAEANGLKLASTPITQQGLSETSGAANAGKTATTEVGLDVQFQNKEDEFVPGTAELTPQARAYVAQIAAQYAPKTLLAAMPADATPAQRDQVLARRVLLVGHTDDSDASLGADPATLSQQRAKSVAKVFVEQGVPMQNIYYQGAGDTLPMASNATLEGRQANQRVQIIDVPSEADLQKYLAQRTANPTDYMFANTPSAQPVSASLADQSDSEAPIAHALPPAHSQTSKPKLSAPSSGVAKTASAPASDAVADRATPPTVAKANPPTLAADHGASSGYDFGGAPTTGTGIPVRLGTPSSKPAFFISNANANSPMTLDSCLGDHPRNASDVRNLATDQVLNVRDYLPGFYGAPWATGLGGNLIALLDVRVPSDAGRPVPEPELKIYKNYAGNSKQKPSFSAHVPVNVYRGSDATLYRMFVQGPMRCLDLVVPNATPRATGNVYYTNRAVDYTASGEFVLH